MKKKLYVGCALTIVPLDKKEAFWEMIKEIKKTLSESFEILEFKGLSSDFTPKEIYEHDIKECVMKADCMLAICDYPSLGLGYEIAIAVEKMGISVLAVAHEDALVAKLIKGIGHKNFKFFYYNSVNEIIKKTLETLTK